MINSLKKTFGALLAALISILIFNRPAYAVGTLYFAPSSGGYAVGSTLQTSVMVNTGGETINAISAHFSYPTDLLDFAWISESGSFMTVWAEKIGGGGVVKLAGGLPTPGFSGRELVATVGFKVKKIGQANLSFISGSHVLKDSDNSDILSLGGSGRAGFSLVASQPTQPEPTPTPVDEEPPTISQIEVLGLTENRAIVSWKTDEEADSLVEYGIEPGKYLISTSQKGKTEEHRVPLLGLASDTAFYFRVTSQDVAGNIGTSEEYSFTTPTLPTPTLLLKLFYQNLYLWLIIVLLLAVVFVTFLINHKKYWLKKLLEKLPLTLGKKNEYNKNQEETEPGSA